MKNVTIALDDVVFDHANQRAAELDKSLEAVLCEFAQTFGSGGEPSAGMRLND